MNRHDWEVQVKASDLNPTARLIALVLGSFGNWKEDKTVEPGEARLAKETGLDPSTVATYMDAFVEQEWIRPVGKGKYNTTIYELCEVSHEATGVLAKKVRKVNRKSRENLRKGNVVVPGTTGDYKELDKNLVPEVTEVSSRSDSVSSRKNREVVPGTTEANQDNHTNNLEEPTTTPAAPVAQIRKDGDNSPTSPNVYSVSASDSLMLEVEETTKENLQSAPKRFLNTLEKKCFDETASIYKATPEQKAQALEQLQTTRWTTDISEAAREALRASGVVVGTDAW